MCIKAGGWKSTKLLLHTAEYKASQLQAKEQLPLELMETKS